MKTKFFTILSSVLVSGLLYAQNIQVTDKWQLLGALENISSYSFDGKCVDFVWKYDNGWQVHIANGDSYNLPTDIKQFDTISKGQGFWVKGHDTCEVNATNSIDVKALLAGKTFYVPGIDGESTKILTKVVFNNDASSVTWSWIVGPAQGGTMRVKIQGNTIIAENPQKFIGKTADYLEIVEYHKDGKMFNARWYYDEAKAKEYLNNLSSNSNNDLKSLIVGKTLYFVAYDDFGHDSQTGYNYARITFDTNGSMSWEEYETVDSGQVYNSTYHIDNNGILHTFDSETEGSGKYSFVSKNSDYITLKAIDDNSLVYLFFDKQKAKEFKDSKNNTQNLKYTKDLIVGKTFYSSHKENSGNSTGYAKFTYSNTKCSGHFMIVNNTTNEIELDTNFNTAYTITSDGRIKSVQNDNEDDSSYIEYNKLKSKLEDRFETIHQEDNNKDGIIDYQNDEIWYFDKPSSYPSSL